MCKRITKGIRIAICIVQRMWQGSKETRDMKDLIVNMLYKYNQLILYLIPIKRFCHFYMIPEKE